MVQFALRGARIRNLEVLDTNDTSLSPDTWKSCHEDPWRKQAGLHGFKQAVGLQRCAEWMLPLHYTWIVRLRTDARVARQAGEPVLGRHVPYLSTQSARTHPARVPGWVWLLLLLRWRLRGH